MTTEHKPTSSRADAVRDALVGLYHYTADGHMKKGRSEVYADGMEALRSLEEQLQAAQEHLSQIRPMRETEWAVLMREHDVLHEARRLSRAVGEINTTAPLDRALKRYDEAVEAEHVASVIATKESS